MKYGKAQKKTTTKDLVRFALKRPDSWHTFYNNKETVALVCAAYNLRCIALNDFGQFKAIEENAKRYVNS